MLGGVTVVNAKGEILWVDRPFGGSRDFFVGRYLWDFAACARTKEESMTHFAWTLAHGHTRTAIGNTGGPIANQSMIYSFDRIEVDKYAVIQRFAPNVPVQLSRKEEEVCALLVRDFRAEEIAEALGISRHTVQTHRSHIMAKVGVRGVAGLTRWWEERTRWQTHT